jgi:hypothetical protein
MMRQRIGQQLQDGERRHRLAGAALAHQRHRLALADLERHPAHRLHLARTAPEGDVQIANLEEGLGH